MRNVLPSIFAAALVLAPAAALAQTVIPEPPMIGGLEIVAIAPAGPLTEQDAAEIAMMNGMAVVEDVDVRMWDGNFKVEGTDITGEELVMRIDHDTGQILEIDD
jgi:hypothetical protein